MLDVNNQRAIRERMSFLLLAAIIFAVASLPYFHDAYINSDWDKMNVGMFSAFVGECFFAAFLWHSFYLTAPFVSQKAFIAWLDHWSLPVFVASVFAIIVLLAISSYTGKLWQESNLINCYTVSLTGLFWLCVASFTTKAYIWNHCEVKK